MLAITSQDILTAVGGSVVVIIAAIALMSCFFLIAERVVEKRREGIRAQISEAMKCDCPELRMTKLIGALLNTKCIPDFKDDWNAYNRMTSMLDKYNDTEAQLRRSQHANASLVKGRDHIIQVFDRILGLIDDTDGVVDDDSGVTAWTEYGHSWTISGLSADLSDRLRTTNPSYNARRPCGYS